MFFKQSWETTTYYIDNKIMIDVVDNGVDYKAWIYNVDIGIKMFMFGVEKNSTNKDDFCNMVQKNMDDYLTFYKNNYYFNEID